MAEMQALNEKSKQTERRLSNATKLTEGLSDEYVRWKPIFDAADAGCDVINLSLGGVYNPTVYLLYNYAISYATSSGSVVVCAAGNEASNTGNYVPACLPISGLIVTASVGGSLSRSSFSNYGSEVDVTAPGEDISSCNYTGGFISLSGTSMAAPHISAACAMIKLSHPGYSPSQIESYLKGLCTDLGPYGYDTSYGYGIPDLSPLAPVPMPDLAALPISCDMDITVGEQVCFQTGIANNGNGDSGIFNVNLDINGVSLSYGPHNGIPAHTTVNDNNCKFYWTPTAAGNYTVTFTVDSDNSIVEDNESNNQSSLMLSVGLPPPSSILVSHINLTIGVGQGTGILSATVLPAGSNETVIWTSMNAGIATVSNTGYITGIGVGSTTIRASTVNGLYADCTINVAKPGKGVTGISLNKICAAIDEGKTLKLKAKLTPGSPANKTIAWSSSNPSVASVDSKGKVYGLVPGAAVITATASSGASAVCTVTVNSLAVSQVTLNNTAITLIEGKSATLRAALVPRNARFKTLAWVSSNPDVACVTQRGAVKGISPGTCTISAIAHNGVKGYCTVTVLEIFASRISLNKRSASIYIGSGLQLTAKITPAKTRNKAVTWASGNLSVAAVDANGYVQSIAVGTATITATTANGLTAACTLTVKPILVSSVALSMKRAVLSPGQQLVLAYAVAPGNATNGTITFTSSNPAVATVDQSGVVTGMAPGKATITCKANDGSRKKASCSIAVQ
jgi:uncharacterized protein YjdB